MFFGIAIGIMVLLFVARIALIAFVFAAIATVVYTAFRGLRRLAFEDHYASGYDTRRYSGPSNINYAPYGIEPLFHDVHSGPSRDSDTRYVQTL